MNRRLLAQCMLAIFFLLSSLAQTQLHAQKLASLRDLVRKAYAKGNLVSLEKGNFMGTGDDEYLAFFERLSAPGDKYSSTEAWGVVFQIKQAHVKAVYDLENAGGVGVWTLTYPGRADLQRIVHDARLSFGRWDGYAYIGDYNDDGIDEILLFQLTGMSFLPAIYEFRGNQFMQILDFETPYNQISGISTETRGGRKLPRIYGYGHGTHPKANDDWQLFQWNQASGKYEVIEQRR